MHYSELFADQLWWNTQGMYLLIVWALINIILGGGYAYLHRSFRSRVFYAGMMCALWNVITLGIASLGLFSVGSIDPALMDLEEILRESFTFERILLLNAGLDIAYIVAGYTLLEKGKHHQKRLFSGFGSAIIVQGAFLLCLDMVLVAINYTYTSQYGLFVLF